MAVPELCQPVVLFLGLTGCRISEMAALQVDVVACSQPADQADRCGLPRLRKWPRGVDVEADESGRRSAAARVDEQRLEELG